MKMIAHQTVGVHLPPGLSARGTQRLKKDLSIQIISKNLLTPIAAIHQVINGALVLNSQLARHRLTLISN
jgi:hypothetical protein